VSRSGFATPIVLVPNAAPPFRETFSLDTPSTKTHCLVRMRSVIVEPNLWNVVPPVPDGACAQTAGTAESGPPAEGSVSWSYRDRVLSMRLDVTRSSRGNGGAGPVGYPEIYYGYSPYSGVASSPMPADFELPSTIGGLPDVVLRTGYMTSGYASTDSNLAYDMFVSRNDLDPSTTDSPNSWCGTGIENPPGTVAGRTAGCLTAPSDVLEIMIWLAHSPVNSSYTPATGTDAPVGEFSPTIGLGARATTSQFEVWSCIYGSIDCDGPGNHSVVSFVLVGASGRALPTGLEDGTISIPLRAFLNRAITVATGEGAPDLSAKSHLNAIELGDEVSPLPGEATGPVTFQLQLSSYCVLFRSMSLGSPVGSCRS